MTHTKTGFSVLLFSAILLIPYLFTGYYFDDILNSCTRGYAELHKVTLFESIKADFTMWVTRNGRFTPLGQLVHVFWYYLPSLGIYRVLQYCLTLLDLGVFALFLKRLGMPNGRIWLTCGIVPLLFQIRNYHDPITSYTAMFQISFLIGIVSALLLLNFFEKRKFYSLSIAVLLFALQLLFYEPAIIFLPIYLVLCLTRRREIAAGVAFVGVTAVYFAVTVLIRYYFQIDQSGYSGTQYGFSFRAIWAFICQTSAALPLVYMFLGKGGLFHLSDLWGREFISLWTLFLATGAGLLFYKLLKNAEHEGGSGPDILFKRIGVLLLFIPSLMTALSARYQLEVNRPGLGYLPVYFAYFGMALLLSGVAIKLKRRRIVITAFIIIAVFSINGNRIAAREMNTQRMGHRLLIQNALRSGLLSDLPDLKVVAHEENSEWTIPECMYQYSHRDIKWVYNDPKLPNDLRTQAYVLRAREDPDGSGWVELVSPKGAVVRRITESAATR